MAFEVPPMFQSLAENCVMTASPQFSDQIQTHTNYYSFVLLHLLEAGNVTPKGQMSVQFNPDTGDEQPILVHIIWIIDFMSNLILYSLCSIDIFWNLCVS